MIMNCKKIETNTYNQNETTDIKKRIIPKDAFQKRN